MSTLEQLREGIGQAWNHLAEGWRHLYDRASRALTKFTPVRREGEIDSVDDYVVVPLTHHIWCLDVPDPFVRRSQLCGLRPMIDHARLQQFP